MSIERELETLIRARYPLIEIVSPEEERVEACLRSLADRLGKRLFCWSAVRGLYDVALPLPKPGTSVDPLVALREVLKQGAPALFLFKELAPCLEEKVGLRMLKEVAQILQASPKTLFLLEPTRFLPTRLEKDIAVLEFPRPTCAELMAMLDRVQADLRPGKKLSLTMREQLAQAALGLTEREAENALARALIEKGSLDAEAVNAVLAEKKQIIRQDGLLEYIDSRAGLESVGGLRGLKRWVGKRGVAFSQEARDFGLPAPRGILLLGVQGCGKSLCAKAVGAAWHLPILRLDVGRLFTSLMGSSESNMRRAISLAESVSPCVLWIDEIEKALAGQRGGESDGGTASRMLATFLTWLQEKQAGVFVIATANDISSLPPELLRKGRLDETFFVDLPEEAERREIFAIHLRAHNRLPKHFDLAALAAASAGFSGSEIEQAVVAGLYEAFDAGEELKDGHLLTAISQTVPLSRVRREEIEALRQWAQSRARSAS